MHTATHITRHIKYGLVAHATVFTEFKTSLTLHSPATYDEAGHSPAASISISNIDGIRAMHQLCADAIAEFDKQHPQPPKQ